MIIVLTSDGGRKQVSFIVCELPDGKEPLLNVETSIALGVLPEQFPEWEYTSGKRYDDEDIIHLFGESESFNLSSDGSEEDPEYNKLGINIMKAVQRLKREQTEKGKTLKEIKERLEMDWATKVLADSLEGICINMQPSKIK